MLASTRWGRAVAFAGVVAWGAIAGAQPANDDCASATVIGALPFTDTVDTTLATTEAGDPPSTCRGGAQGPHNVWYRWTAPAVDSILNVHADQSDHFPGWTAYSGACGALTQLFDCESSADQFGESVFVPAGSTVYVEASHPVGGTLVIDVEQAPEFFVSFETDDRVRVAANRLGQFFVLFRNSPLGFGMYGRLFDAAGLPLTGTFEVLPMSGGRGDSHVAADANDDFIVVLGGADVVGRRVSKTGVPLGVAFPVNTYTTGSQVTPRVAPLPDGGFVVVWIDTARDGSETGVFGQRFDASNAPVGGDFQVNTYTTGPQGDDDDGPTVAADGSGRFMVAWDGRGPQDGGSVDVFMRAYDEAGSPQGPEFLVSTPLDDLEERYPKAAANEVGDFVVAWNRAYSTVRARRFDTSGAPAGPELEVTNDGYENVPNVAMDRAGNFVVTWEADEYYFFREMVARRFSRDGVPLGPQFQVNTVVQLYQYDPDVAADPAGNFVVAWNDYYQNFNTSGYPLLGRAFAAPGLACAPAALAGCRTPTTPLKSKLLLVDEPDDTDDQLRWKFVKGEATDPAAIGDPTSDEDYVLCMYDGAGTALLMENRIFAGGTCGTKPCWKALGNPPGATGHRYKSKDRTPHGILKMVVKPGPDGKSKVVVKGGQDLVFRGGAGAPPLPLPLPVTVQLQNRSGECWQATYDVDGVGTNEAGFYKGSGS